MSEKMEREMVEFVVRRLGIEISPDIAALAVEETDEDDE